MELNNREYGDLAGFIPFFGRISRAPASLQNEQALSVKMAVMKLAHADSHKFGGYFDALRHNHV